MYDGEREREECERVGGRCKCMPVQCLCGSLCREGGYQPKSHTGRQVAKALVPSLIRLSVCLSACVCACLCICSG